MTGSAISIKINFSLPKEYPIRAGAPHESVLTPSLYKIYTANISWNSPSPICKWHRSNCKIKEPSTQKYTYCPTRKKKIVQLIYDQKKCSCLIPPSLFKKKEKKELSLDTNRRPNISTIKLAIAYRRIEV